MKKPLKFGDALCAIAAAIILTCSLLAGSGCALLRSGSTTEQKANDVRNLAYAAASIGTQEALLQNSSWRPQFESALLNLDILVETKTITGALLRQILASLPVKELKSAQARIAIEAATILFDSTAGTTVNIENAPYVTAAATGIRDGLKIALNR